MNFLTSYLRKSRKIELDFTGANISKHLNAFNPVLFRLGFKTSGDNAGRAAAAPVEVMCSAGTSLALQFF